MKRSACLIIGLLLSAGVGCARRDWVTDMLVLADVTGTWTGTIEMSTVREVALSLNQSGARVTGESTREPLRGSVEGTVTGDVLTFGILGARTSITGDATIDGDEMMGVLRLDPQLSASDRCPCRIRLRRARPGDPAWQAQ